MKEIYLTIRRIASFLKFQGDLGIVVDNVFIIITNYINLKDAKFSSQILGQIKNDNVRVSVKNI